MSFKVIFKRFIFVRVFILKNYFLFIKNSERPEALPLSGCNTLISCCICKATEHGDIVLCLCKKFVAAKRYFTVAVFNLMPFSGKCQGLKHLDPVNLREAFFSVNTKRK